MRKKFTAIITILVMIFTMIPADAYADNGKPVALAGSDGIVKGEYDTLDQAAVDAEDGDIISLNDDITMKYYEKDGKNVKPTMYIEDKNITLDGNGHTVTAENKAFTMIEVKAEGGIEVKNIILDGSGAENRIFSNIILIEGGEAIISDGAVLRNNLTTALGVGVNKENGICIMNGGIIENNYSNRGDQTGAAVTVKGNCKFIMNGGIIRNNRTETKSAPGIMVKEKGTAILNKGTITGNSTTVKSVGSAITAQGGYIEINSNMVISGNTSSSGYAAVCATNWYSPSTVKLNGCTVIDNKDIDGNNVACVADRYSGNELIYSGTVDIKGKNIVYATWEDFNYIKADSTLNPVNPIEIDVKNEYVKGQKIVEYTSGTPEPEDFVTSDSDYCFVKSEDEKFLEVAENEGYEITATSGKNGTISPSGVIKVKKGESRTFTFIPEDGYTVDSVFVDGKNCGNIPSYSFTAVDKNHTISVSFKEKEKEPPIIVYPEITSIDPIPDQIYTGDEIKPSLTVRDQYGEVIEPNNYIVEYSENIEAGIAKVKVTGKAGVLKSAETTFRIVLSDYDMISGSQLKINKVKSDFGRIRVYFDRIKIGDRKIHYQIVSQKIGSEKKKIQYATIGYDYSTVRNLEYNRIYNIKIRAYFKDENGKRYYSPWSEEVQCYSNRLGNANQVMYRPSITKLIAGKTSVAVDLKKVEFKKDPVKITYQIAYKKKGATKFSYAYTTNLKKTVYNLSKNTNYQFKVRYYYKSLVDNKLVFSPYTVLKTVKTAR